MEILAWIAILSIWFFLISPFIGGMSLELNGVNNPPYWESFLEGIFFMLWLILAAAVVAVFIGCINYLGVLYS